MTILKVKLKQLHLFFFLYYLFIVLKDGKVNGIGTHEELLKRNEEYQSLYINENN